LKTQSIYCVRYSFRDSPRRPSSTVTRLRAAPSTSSSISSSTSTTNGRVSGTRVRYSSPRRSTSDFVTCSAAKRTVGESWRVRMRSWWLSGFQSMVLPVEPCTATASCTMAGLRYVSTRLLKRFESSCFVCVCVCVDERERKSVCE